MRETFISVRHLVWKDLFLQRRMLVVMFLNIYLFISIWSSAETYFGGALLGYILAIAVGGYEGRNAEVLLNSLPIPRWSIVGAKYLFCLAYVPLIALAFWSFNAILPLLGFGVRASIAASADLVVGITSVIFMMSLYWPAYFTWGLTKSRYWNLAVLIAFWIVFPVVHSAVASLFSDTPSGALGAALVIAALAAIMTVVSFWLSVRFYRRREF